VTPDELRSLSEAKGDRLRILDIREAAEFEAEHIPGALNLASEAFYERVEAAIPDRGVFVVTYCEEGVRSRLVAETLRERGYENVASLAGGLAAWRAFGQATEHPAGLTDEQAHRYRRHLMMPDVGAEGQRKLLASKVLVVGAGGLGSPAAFYLAAAGVGRLGIVDFDQVDETNLQRQILHTTDRIGMPKTESARETLLALNPGITVDAIEARLTSANAESLLADWDVVVDGTDNFAARSLINEVCVRLRKPNVHGSVYRFEGQVTVLTAQGGPCYRCIYPELPAPELSPSCAEAGVLGVLPGVIGLLQAVEVVKLRLGKGKPLVGRLLHFDALGAEFREFRVRRDPRCAVCGE
jgi:molybdopterin/thiamine biosynthesis adenylyltransferase/rhodanese-related sulfurtransferase